MSNVMRFVDPCGLKVEFTIQSDLSSSDTTPTEVGDYITMRRYGKQVQIERFEPKDKVWFNKGLFVEL